MQWKSNKLNFNLHLTKKIFLSFTIAHTASAKNKHNQNLRDQVKIHFDND